MAMAMALAFVGVEISYSVECCGGCAAAACTVNCLLGEDHTRVAHTHTQHHQMKMNAAIINLSDRKHLAFCWVREVGDGAGVSLCILLVQFTCIWPSL